MAKVVDRARAAEFLSKAERLLGWAESSANEMQRHGSEWQMSAVERHFWSQLALICSAHEALADAAKKLLLHSWRTSFESLRKSDPLLYYLWQARNKETHDSVVTYSRDPMVRFTLKIVDPDKAYPIANQYNPYAEIGDQLRRLQMFIFEVDTMEGLFSKLASGQVPSDERIAQAGVVITGFQYSLSLSPFQTTVDGKRCVIPCPTSHLGVPIAPSTTNAVLRAIAFYKSKLNELQEALAAS